MKTLIGLAVALISFSSTAHEIEGTLVLKGSLKSKLYVSGIKTTCKAKVDDVKNLMDQDSYGNPAYKVKLEVSLSGRNGDRRIKFDKTYLLNNLFREGNGSIVRDFEYASPEGASMRIDGQGRMKSVQFPYGHQKINCTF